MDDLLDLKDSKLLLEGTKKEQKEWSHKIEDSIQDLNLDKSDRKLIYQKRKDFYEGNQGAYSNITGILKDTKMKKGHNNQVTNYAGKTCVKLSYALANNPPKLTCAPNDPSDNAIEGPRAQAVESYVDSILDHRRNQFWKKVYRRGCFIQSEFGDFAMKIYPVDDQIKIVGHDDMSTLMVGWNGEDPNEFDFVISETFLTAKKIFDLWGIKVNEKLLADASTKTNESMGSWKASDLWGTKTASGTNKLPTGRTELPTVRVIEYDSEDVYAIKVAGELCQLVFKDDVKFPRIKFWIIVKNIPNPPSPWSIADIDYLIDPQIELNDNDCRSADHLRVGNVQRYVAYNIEDFNPEDLNTSSGQVIYINDPDGRSRFEPLATNINNFPDDQYHNRKLAQIYDLGLPKVNYGQASSDSGRSKAIDYQSSVEITVFKRDSWELALQELTEKIQILGNFLKPELEFFKDEEGNFVLRRFEFDWADTLPISQSDKVVNVLNKYMMGIPLRQAYKEMGYRNVEAMVEELKQELKDPNLMTLRAKAWQFSEGLLQAQQRAAAEMPPQPVTGQPGQPVPTNPNQPSPVLTRSQNQSSSKPVSQKGGTTASFSTAGGFIDRTRQNLQAQGK